MMRVVKRNGEHEDVSFDKVLNRLQVLSADIDVNVFSIAQKVCSRIYDGVKTAELDELAAHLCSSMLVEHPDYGKLASRIIVSNHHKNTSPSFSETVLMLYNNMDEDGNACPIVSKELYDVVMKNKTKLNSYIDYSRDYAFDYFGFKTLERSYLMKIKGIVVERPQHMWMRVALGIHGADFKDALHTYDMMSKKYFTHATPTLFNSGTPRPQNSSCFLLSMNEDSISGIFDTLKEVAMISKYSGGIGLHMHQIRPKGSRIRGTNGVSDGIIPMLRVYNNTARYVNQSGKRNGSIAMYLEPWHADIEGFLELRKNHGNEEERCRDLFLALWVPDLFMERVKANGKWSLMCPDRCQGLSDVWGQEFATLYERYESEGKFIKQVNAQDLWFKILECQIETGVPYICYKDAANKKSNQQNIGTIKSSNLCTEVMQVSTPDEIAVCNLASICLPSYVDKNENGEAFFDYDKLHDAAKTVTKNLNKVIDRNFYPVEKARRSNLKHRPIGVGVQGLADVFLLLRMPFESVEAKELNKQVFETIYHGALESSMEISKKRHDMVMEAREKGKDPRKTPYKNYLKLNEFEMDTLDGAYPGAYSSFEGSPASKGILQFDMWDAAASDRYDWASLKSQIQSYGIRNSLLLAPMPTASTAQIMGFNESFEPFTSNIFKRKTLSGEFIVVNKYLIDDLIALGLWNNTMKDTIILNDGSIQSIDSIPDSIKALYKTVWEIKQKHVIDMSVERGRFICQSQSLNIFMEDPDFKKLSSMHFYGWANGIKTGSYYIRTKPRAKAAQFTIDPAMAKIAVEQKKKNIVCNDEVCLVCSS
jgi:ribonucleoside-diphosphate reductase alpha chain